LCSTVSYAVAAAVAAAAGCSETGPHQETPMRRESTVVPKPQVHHSSQATGGVIGIKRAFHGVVNSLFATTFCVRKTVVYYSSKIKEKITDEQTDPEERHS
jgi:hypothetical protein